MGFSLLDLIFPKRCVSCGKFGEYICRACFLKIEYVNKPICGICQRQAMEGRTHPGCRGRYRLDGLVVVCRYRGPIKLAIQKVKYKWIFDIEKVFVDLTADNLWKFGLPKDLILVPVPLYRVRKKWRGFNQAEILAKSLAKRFDQPYLEVLERVRDTRSQVGLKRKERFENVTGAFGIKSEIDVSGKNLLIIDDVFTSGATIGECARVLKRAGAEKVWAMSVALG